MVLFTEVDMFTEWFPQIKEVSVLKSMTHYRSLFICKQDMPWPLAPREMVCTGTGIIEPHNKAALYVMRSIDEG